jgi:hypothetical protein
VQARKHFGVVSTEFEVKLDVEQAVIPANTPPSARMQSSAR